MKERIALLRRDARRSSGGYSLIELMVVVVLVAIVAGLAAPSFVRARDDKVAFDYARQYQQVLLQARSRAAGTGSASLVLLTGGTGGRGIIRAYAALDENDPPAPVSSCKANADQWANAVAEPTVFQIDEVLSGSGTRHVRFVSFANINRLGVNVDMDLTATLTAGSGTTNAAMAATKAIAVCVTPSGNTFVGWADTVADALTNMRSAPPFNGIVEAAIQRHVGGAGVGLKRRVVLTGGGAPRLRSE
jgi:prepilin-type N-terminal cleavage/methylation domain-containing protein